MAALRLRARWVVPVVGDPIPHGAVLVGADGRIELVGPDVQVPHPAGAEAHDLGNAAILPGLVNTHTHLELTALRGLVTGTVFPRWIQTIRRVKDGMQSDQFRASARWGVLEHFAHGATTIGDTGSTGAAAWAMADLGARGIAYQEVFGPDPAQTDEAMAGLRRTLLALDPAASERVTIGVSPHAPYTVSRKLAGSVAWLAGYQKRPLAMHVAESSEERAFIEEGRGPFAEHLRSRGIEVAAQGMSPLAWALRAGLEVARPLLIHCVQLVDSDFQRIEDCGATVAHCPCSNQVLGVGRANLGRFRDAGVMVGVGTDSVAAGNTYDLFNESRVAAMGVPLTPRERLALITTSAADALGLALCGRLVPGAWGDICAISLKRPAFVTAQNIEGAIASAAQAADVTHTWVAGRLVYENGTWPGVDAEAERAAVTRAAKEVAQLPALPVPSHI